MKVVIALQVRTCLLSGLLDLNQGNSNVRTQIREYLNNLISMGVAGFRVDAAKSIWPNDLKFIYGSTTNLKSEVRNPQIMYLYNNWYKNLRVIISALNWFIHTFVEFCTLHDHNTTVSPWG